MNQLQLFLPCAAGVEDFLADEVHRLTGLKGDDLLVGRGGVQLRASWRDALLLNLNSRLTQRVLVQLSITPYRSENDLYEAASAIAWEIWFTTKQSFKIEVTAQHSPLTSLNFAALKIKDAVADRFRAKRGERPDVVHVHGLGWSRLIRRLAAVDAPVLVQHHGEPVFNDSDLQMAGYWGEISTAPSVDPALTHYPCSVSVTDIQNAMGLQVQGFDSPATSAIWSSVGVRPVPMAQTGS